MTIPRFLLLLPCLAIAMVGSQPARADDEASRILTKMRQLDLLNQLVPVLMTSEQYKKLLPTVEKARQADAATLKLELADMKKIEPKVDAAIKDAKEKSLVPSRELQTEVITTLQGFQKRREAMVTEQNELVLKAVEETLDAGQIKAAANALSVPAGEGSKLSDRDKLRRWVRAVLMDPLTYDLMVELSKK